MPPAPAAPPPAAPLAPPPPPPAPTTTIRVSEMPGTPTPNAPPKKGSVRDSMFKKLREKATTGPPMDDAEPTPTPEPRAPSTPSNQPEPEPEPATEPTPAEPTAATDPKAAADPKKGKVNPWKLVDEYKGKIAKLESEVAEAGKRGIPKPEWEAVQSKLTKVEARAKELEEEIKYVNYTKSEEYKVKYEEPYVKAWGRAMGELKELTVEDGQGNQRPVSQDDLLELVNLPLVKAKQMATEKFGEFADEVMSHRKEIRKLHDESAAALEQARKAAGERETATGAQQKEMQSSVLQEWNRSNEEIVSNEKYGTYFKPVEGDEQGNQRLAKGFELADRAFSESPLDPRLTPEQRKSIVQRHAVVRNRAAAFGRLVHQIGQKEARIAELEKELSGYRGSEPDAEGRRPAPTSQAAGGTKMDGVLADLRRRAK